jgi:S-adenosylmethionine hydrolase
MTLRFPPGTIHVAVVDPGVGTSRQIVYVEIDEQRYIAPDNGLLSYLAAKHRPRLMVALENPAYWLPQTSSTFHGRDIMAPAAAHLASGLDPKKLGSTKADIVHLDWPLPQRVGDTLIGEVLLVDSFGNVITNVHRETLTELAQPGLVSLEIAGHSISGVMPTYGSAPCGQLIAVFDSQNRLEVAQVGGNAAALLSVEPGMRVDIRL